MLRTLTVRHESFPVRGLFRTARGGVTSAEVIVAEISRNGVIGRGECTPFTRGGESIASVLDQLKTLGPILPPELTRDTLPGFLERGAARNALDCALWDFDAKCAGVRAWQLAGLAEPGRLITACTIGVASPEVMAEAARNALSPLIKLKLDGGDDLARIRAVRAAMPRARLIADADESWTLDQLRELAPAFRECGVELIEQPLPADQDEALRGFDCPVALCGDESFLDSGDIDRLRGLYSVLNIKLDKCGGLTEALKAQKYAADNGLRTLTGCMISTSLALAPATLLAQNAGFVDLDGSSLLLTDRNPGLRGEDTRIGPPPPTLWG
ncbi:MAG: dipeptide epimerase [Rhodospirillaceae bacterium]|nr:dipeptide epimerase [Rhodospirillaceae bacterium]